MEVTHPPTGLVRSMVDKNGKTLQVEIREKDGYFNATLMCQSAGKEWKNYWKAKDTKAYVEALEKSVANGAALFDSRKTGPYASRGTWVHEQIAVDLARWISPSFGVFISGLVLRYARGELTTEESKAAAAEVSEALEIKPSHAGVDFAIQWNDERGKAKEMTKAASSAIQACGDGKRKIGANVHISYNDGLNTAVTGRKTSELRRELGLKKSCTPRDRMQPEQLAMIQFQAGMIRRKLEEATRKRGVQSDADILSSMSDLQRKVYGLCSETGAHTLQLLDHKPPKPEALMKALEADRPNKRQQQLLSYYPKIVQPNPEYHRLTSDAEGDDLYD